jgi:ATP adenylyltransferase
MDRLWTPWRFAYVSSVGHADEGCVFCRILSEERDAENLVLLRGRRAFVLLNMFPYTSGHLLVVANRHAAFLRDLEREELHAFSELAQVCEQALRSAYNPEGFNMGFNLGACAGAGVGGHVHMHVLPRWTGDSSFMTVVSETRVLPEALGQTHRRLSPYFRDLTI